MEETESGPAIKALLEKKMTDTVNAMRSELNQSLFGRGSDPPLYRQEYPKLSGLESIIKDNYSTAIKDNIFSESPYLEMLKKPKEGTMSDSEIVNKVIRERKEKRALEVIEYLDGYFGSIDAEAGTTVTWNVVFADSDKTYCYAAVRGDRKWYITFDRTDYSTEELIAKIAELALRGDVYFPNDESEPL